MKPSLSRAPGLLAIAGRILFPRQAAEAQTIVLASTTSLQDSGLFDRMFPLFTARTGIKVLVIAQGTGQALATATHGDADLVLVHDPAAEAAFMAAGQGISRTEVAWNSSAATSTSS